MQIRETTKQETRNNKLKNLQKSRQTEAAAAAAAKIEQQQM